jgi:hypothetical protein
LLVTRIFAGHCEENLIAGTARKAICEVMNPVGYLLLIVLPPTSVLVLAIVGYAQRRPGILIRGFLAGVAIGMGAPAVIGLVVGY